VVYTLPEWILGVVVCSLSQSSFTLMDTKVARGLASIAYEIIGFEYHREITMTFTIRSSAFDHHANIPKKYTCEGEDLSPHLEWFALPEGSKSLVLIVDDPDAPDPKAPKMTYVHWLLYNIPTTSNGLMEAVASQDLPLGTKEGKNDWNKTGYGGPCPPIGEHRYFFKLYALDSVLPDLNYPNKAALEKAMMGKIMAEAQLMGTYKKVK